MEGSFGPGTQIGAAISTASSNGGKQIEVPKVIGGFKIVLKVADFYNERLRQLLAP